MKVFFNYDPKQSLKQALMLFASLHLDSGLLINSNFSLQSMMSFFYSSV
jgi:hypothetical protein